MPATIDPSYQFTSEEIFTILPARIRERSRQRRLPTNSYIKVRDAYTHNFDSKLDEIFTEEAKNLRFKLNSNILIICEIKSLDWVGIHLEITKGKLVHATFISSLPKDCSDAERVNNEKKHFNIAKGKINSTFACDMKYIKLIQQVSNIDSQLFAIENLVHSVIKLSTVGAWTGPQLRRQYFVLLHKSNQYSPFEDEYRPEEYAHDEEASTLPLTNSVSSDVNEYFQTFSILTKRITGYLQDEIALSKDISHELRTKFETVFDHRTGRLVLQLKEGAARTLNVQQLLTMDVPKRTIRKNVIDFAGKPFIGFMAGAAAGSIVEVFTETQLLRSIALVVETDGALAGAGVIIANPVVLGLGIFGAALALAYSCNNYINEESIRIIKTANDAYYTNQILDNNTLEKVLSELDNLPYFTSTNRLQYSRILRAFILIKREKPGAMEIFDDILNNTKDTDLQGFCFIGKILFYTQPKKYITDPVITQEECHKQLIILSSLLNQKYPDIAKAYFSAVISAYQGMYLAVSKKSFLESTEKFIEDLTQIEKFTQMPDLACFRYMHDKGAMAEISFVFMQAMAHEASALHYENLIYKSKSDYIGDMTVFKEAKLKYKAAQDLHVEAQSNYSIRYATIFPRYGEYSPEVAELKRRYEDSTSRFSEAEIEFNNAKSAYRNAEYKHANEQSKYKAPYESTASLAEEKFRESWKLIEDFNYDANPIDDTAGIIISDMRRHMNWFFAKRQRDKQASDDRHASASTETAFSISYNSLNSLRKQDYIQRSLPEEDFSTTNGVREAVASKLSRFLD